ncbi:MAG: hypothetical protein K0S65_2463 [Labilithrix sp.]|nr:hypothetical protein [Labilithrix sp.]
MRLRFDCSAVLLFCISSSVACGGKIDADAAGGGGSSAGNGSSTGSGSSKAPDCGPVAGTPKVIGPLHGSATNVVADSDAVYWCEEDGRNRTEPAVIRWDFATGTLTSLAGARCGMMIGDGPNLFWSSASQQLGRIAKDGSGSEVLFTGNEPRGSSPSGGWYDLAVDETFAYWADFRETGGIYRGPKRGGSSELLIADRFPTGVAVDGDAVYWVSPEGVKKRSKATGQTVMLSTGRTTGGLGSSNLQLDDKFVYWVSPRGIERTPKAGGATERFVARENPESVYTISIQAGCMYFGAGTDLYRRPLTGGAKEVKIASSTRGLNVFWFSASAKGVFWTDWEGYEDDGEVYMLPLTP